jgi:hypothetical protein
MLSAASRALRRQVTPKRVLAALGVFCLCQAALLLVHNRFLAGTGQPVLDLRPEGYNADDAIALLGACGAGSEARTQYLLLEAIDLGAYMWALAYLLSALLSVASAVAPVEVLKWSNLLPWLAALADAAENGLTLTALLAQRPNLTATLAPHLATASRVKWGLLYATACVLVGGGLYTLAVAAGMAGKQRRQAGVGDATRGGGAAGSSSRQQQRQRSGKQQRKQR